MSDVTKASAQPTDRPLPAPMPPPSAERYLAEAGILLPDVPAPIANFLPYRRNGGVIFLAGQTCEWNGALVYRGKIGVDFDLTDGIEAARICALNLLAALRHACGGSLDRVTGCLRVGGFVNCTPDYLDVPHVINGASDLFHEVFGERGLHARTAVGVATLPQGAAVEVDAIFAVD
jgi:enamine deaminase RidA (YjgF/YER057c/UK114 family)